MLWFGKEVFSIRCHLGFKIYLSEKMHAALNWDVARYVDVVVRSRQDPASHGAGMQLNIYYTRLRQ